MLSYGFRRSTSPDPAGQIRPDPSHISDHGATLVSTEDLELITEPDTAALLHMSRDWLARQARANRVPFVKFGSKRYYTPQQIAEIIASRSSPVDTDDQVGPAARRRRARNRAA